MLTKLELKRGKKCVNWRADILVLNCNGPFLTVLISKSVQKLMGSAGWKAVVLGAAAVIGNYVNTKVAS